MDTHLTLVLLGCVLLLGLYLGRAARRLRLPSLIGYMLLGILLGPSLANVLGEAFFDEARLRSLGFITDLALGLVAFSIGTELRLAGLRRLGKGIVAIIFAESLCAFAATTGLVYAFTWLLGGADLPLALIFGAMAPASAPAGTVAVIQECRSKGPLTQALYAVVGFDDGLAIVIFGFAAALARTLLEEGSAGSVVSALAAPALEIVESLLVGGLIGFAFCQVVRFMNDVRELLVVVMGAILVATGLSIQMHLSLILTNLVVGFVLVNTRREELVARVTAPLLDIMPLIFILFFCLAGAHLDLAKLPALGLVGLVYIVGRSAGLIGGARLGAMMGDVAPTVKKYVGLGILSQAGVAIGLSLIVATEFAGLANPHAAEIGAQVLTTITATCIIFEIVGPILTKTALARAGEIPPPSAASAAG
jgi:Kef-type K+ transport system membrane component KefB